GNVAGSIGTLTVTGASSILDAGNHSIAVGSSGEGHLIISGGGAVSGAAATVGSVAGSHGDVNLTGSGSIWTVNGQLGVGNGGVGAITISSGATLNAANAPFSATIGGPLASSSGTVSLSGSGSSWAAGQNITVGGAAGAGSLTIGNGAALACA